MGKPPAPQKTRGEQNGLHRFNLHANRTPQGGATTRKKWLRSKPKSPPKKGLRQVSTIHNPPRPCGALSNESPHGALPNRGALPKEASLWKKPPLGGYKRTPPCGAKAQKIVPNRERMCGKNLVCWPTQKLAPQPTIEKGPINGPKWCQKWKRNLANPLQCQPPKECPCLWLQKVGPEMGNLEIAGPFTKPWLEIVKEMNPKPWNVGLGNKRNFWKTPPECNVLLVKWLLNRGF